MAYTETPTVATGDLWTAANHNTYIRDNLAAGVPDIFAAKGDLAVASAADAAARLAVGADGSQLIADSSQPLGIKWSIPHIGMELLQEQVLQADAAQVDFINISATPFRHLRVLITARSSAAAVDANVYLRINGDATGYIYDYREIQAAYASATLFAPEAIAQPAGWCGTIAANNALAGSAGFMDITFPYYANTAFHKIWHSQSIAKIANTSQQISIHHGAGFYRAAVAISSIRFIVYPSMSNFMAGSIFSLYGIV